MGGIAMPGLKLVFVRVLARPVQGGGHVGFIVNKPTKMSLSELFPGHEPSKKVADPLFLGGTVDMNLVFALVEEHGSRKDGSIRIAPDLFFAYETKAVDRIIESESDHARFFLGMVVWRPGQLDEEIDHGLWYVDAPQRAISAAMNAANSSGEPAAGIAPSASRRVRNSGVCIMRRISAFSFITISREVPAGARIPYQPDASNPFTPDSSSVGICGSDGRRVRLVTASARRRPEFTCGITAGAPLIPMDNCPEIRSVSISPTPL